MPAPRATARPLLLYVTPRGLDLQSSSSTAGPVVTPHDPLLTVMTPFGGSHGNVVWKALCSPQAQGLPTLSPRGSHAFTRPWTTFLK